MSIRRAIGLLVALGVVGCQGGGGSSESKRSTDTRGDGGVTSTSSTRRVLQGAPGCADRAAAIAPGEMTLTLTSSGAPRTYIRHIPAGYRPGTPIPVVLDFHGSAEAAQVHVGNSALGPYGDEQGFVTITPQGLGSGLESYWDTAFHGRIDSVDIRFVGDLLDEVERTLCVDERRVFATGYSNGAFLVSAIACVYADRFAAVAPIAGIRDHKGCHPSRAVPMVVFHGTADRWVAFDGGIGPDALAIPPDSSGRTLAEKTGFDEGRSIPTVVAAWAERNRCPDRSSERHVASDVTLVRYTCPRGADVDFYRIEGAGHSWPGSKFAKQLEAILGPTTFSISADEKMWQFFHAHPLPQRD